MDYNHLLVFVEVAKTGSFSKAALRLGMDKSKVSRVVASLESALKQELIYRTTRQFGLTAEGEKLWRLIDKPLLDLKEAFTQVSKHEDELDGELRLSVPEDCGVSLVPQILGEFSVLHPKLKVHLNVTNQRVDLIKDSFDLALRMGRLNDSSFRQKKIGRVQMFLLASSQLWNHFARPTTIEDLQKIPYLGFTSDSGVPISLRMQKGPRVQILKLKSQISSNNFFSLRHLAMQSLGFTAVPSFLVEREVRSGELQVLFADWIVNETDVSLLMPNQKEIPLRVRKLIEFLQLRLAPVWFSSRE